MRVKLAVSRSTVLSVLCGALLGFSLSYFIFASTDHIAWNPYTGKVSGEDGEAQMPSMKLNL